MDELQFIIPDLDTSAIRKYLEQHVKHALDTLADPDISITDEISKLELYRLNEAAKHLDILKDVYETWQLYRKSTRESLLWILQDMEKFDKEPESAE
jgi:hypothetical protein